MAAQKQKRLLDPWLHMKAWAASCMLEMGPMQASCCQQEAQSFPQYTTVQRTLVTAAIMFVTDTASTVKTHQWSCLTVVADGLQLPSSENDSLDAPLSI